MSHTRKQSSNTSSSTLFTRGSSPPPSSSQNQNQVAPLSPRLQSLTSAFAPASTPFERAALVVYVSNNSSSIGTPDSERVVFSAEEQLLLYGAYKQATKGNVKGPKPTFFDIAARSKWQAWSNMQGKTADQAKDEYVDMVVKSLRKSGNHPDLWALADEILQNDHHHQQQQTAANLDKDLPPISIHEPASAPTTTLPTSAPSSSTSNSNSSSFVRYPTRKSSLSHSLRSNATGMHSAATSVYELASESLADNEFEPEAQSSSPNVHNMAQASTNDDTNSIGRSRSNSNSNSSSKSGYEASLADQEYAGPEYHEITETVVEEEILNDDQYQAELESRRLNIQAASNATLLSAEDTRGGLYTHQAQDQQEEDDDDVYQSSEEYDDDDQEERSESDNSSIHGSPRFSGELLHHQEDTHLKPRMVSPAPRPESLEDDEIFDEEEQDEEEALLSPTATLNGNDNNSFRMGTNKLRSRGGSVSSGYGGSVFSDKEDSVVSPPLDFASILTDLSKEKYYQADDKYAKGGLTLPDAEPHRVQAVFALSPPGSPFEPQVTDVSTTLSSPSDTTSTKSSDAPAVVPAAVPSSTLASAPTAGGNEKAQVAVEDASNAPTNHSSMDGLVCPVSKKSAASGKVCPAAMFAQARAAAAAAAAAAAGASVETSNGPTTNPIVTSDNVSSTVHTSSNDIDQGKAGDTPHEAVEDSAVSENSTSKSSSTLEEQPRSLSMPTTSSKNETLSSSSSSSFSSSSSMMSATRQGRRLGQGIVSRFSALRSSLAAASARAASSALSGGGGSSANKTVTTVVVQDPGTQQQLTVTCPHLAQVQVLETEVVRLQTDISVLHERLDLLQESLKIKSQTRAQQRRSARGILMLVLRQGLINAVLLMVVFAILYKRRSPIAFAVIAYVSQGKKEGEAGWRAFLRWTGDIVRLGQRNHQLMLNAGRRRGIW